LVFNKDKLKSRGHQNEITQNLAILDRLESNKNSVTIMPEKNSEQKVEIEKEVIDLKSLKNVSSNVDVIIDSIENFSKNITKRNERKNGKKEGCNVCKLPCV
jgi:pyruvate/2-oxoglutarate/acetoin dehydrogenase E1 component